MQVILTHEQADFDALASMLGAYLLNVTAIPVIPRRINRNVRAFLTLYGRDLPFTDPRDLPTQPIDAVTLVDTQSLTSLKGMSQAARVHVVDHHPPKDDIPSQWTVRTEDLGATTTMFVEALNERGCVLTPVQATMLLLGIYEDTGSLTYTRTTARDIRAAAFLLDRGANLELAGGFLQHPLSLAQQALYDHLRGAAEIHSIHGHKVIVAIGDAQGMNEEISTIAHKLRDLLEPDAIFLLVTTRGGVQLVARSTSDQIDVGAVAAHFNGGGHERAAAALIRKGDRVAGRVLAPEPALVQAELLRILPHHTRPAIQVFQIMSRGPQVISPDTPVQEVAQRMQRYGYEGYPVVDNNNVVGLLTRRAVDRALSHKLNLTAASLMMAGNVTIQPDDSIEHLQGLMIDTGWGQIPVIHPDSKEIVGIVTRTDLIKTLAPEPKVPGLQNLSERLESALPRSRVVLLKAVAGTALQHRAALYIVGGFVRDLLLERPSLDFDLVVEGDAIALTRALAKRYGGRLTSHARFGTAKWHIAAVRRSLLEAIADDFDLGWDADEFPYESLPQTLDLVSARTEFYTHPTALPTVERGSIKLDLHRRDFTINTLALRLDGGHYGELHDYWGGLSDLRQKLVRVLHSLSFVDDPTRILRAVRFENRFGFDIEDRTLELLKEARPLMQRVSGDRIRHELNAILAEKRADRMLSRLDELELLASIHPLFTGDDWLYNKIASLPEIHPTSEWGLTADFKGISHTIVLSYALWFLRLPLAQLKRVIKRLKFRNDLAVIFYESARVWRNLPSLPGAAPSEIVAHLNGVSPMALYAAYLAADDPSWRDTIETYVKRWRDKMPSVSGHDLRARGLPPGPTYRQILDDLRAAWLDGKVSSPETESALLDQLIKKYMPHRD
jgi:tRNA nucleotidyltransferase (CCA-adding enzyme)